MSCADYKALPSIPLIETGPDFPIETLRAGVDEAHLLLDGATRGVPRKALAMLDTASRRWLAKWNHEYLVEIDEIARELGRPGAYFLSVNYEWGCTTGVFPAPDGAAARLVRVLDWRTPGLGRYIMAADVDGPAGRFVTLTWPGYTGVLQASAPGRFAGAINQAPMPKRGGGFYPFDWLANKVQLWKTPHPTPAHVLRMAFERAPDFRTARGLLIETPIAAPVIFALAGVRPNELCIIERTEDAARVYDGPSAAANAWQAPGWNGRPRGQDSVDRTSKILTLQAGLSEPASWLAPPILNERTRLVLVAEPASGRLVAQGFEKKRPVTAPRFVPSRGPKSSNGSHSSDALETEADAS
jgi:hypothetical protein